MAERKLPGHIEASLAGAGGATDSAGVSWQGRDLSETEGPAHNFATDDGSADPGYAAAAQELAAGTGDEADVVAALASARLFVPIVAQLGGVAEGMDGLVADKTADMALVMLTGPDGRSALPVFSAVEHLRNWHPKARPVAAYAPRVALSAVSEKAELVVVDPGADLTFVLRRPAVWAVAKQQLWIPSYRDPAVSAIIASAVAEEPAVVGVEVAAGSGICSVTGGGTEMSGGGSGPELRLVVHLGSGLDRSQLEQLLERVQRRLASDELFVERVDSLEVRVAPGN